MLAETIYYALNSRNVIVLGNNKGNKAFPTVLAEKPDTACKITGFGERFVL